MSDDRTLAQAMRPQVLDVALARRPAGQPVDGYPPCSPLDGFRAAAQQLHQTLLALSADEWSATAHASYGSVHDVIAHLVGVERLVLEWVTAPSDAPMVATDHQEATADAIAELTNVTGEELAGLWFDAALRVAAACAVADAGKPILAHDLPTDVDGLLVLRAFELWAHLEDVCLAVGRPVPLVEPTRLSMMTQRLMASAPLAVLLRGERVTVSPIRFVLTGAASGTFDVTFLRPDGEPEADSEGETTVIVDAVELCRLAARRRAPDLVGAYVEGTHEARGAARVVLSTLDAFARD